MGISSHGWIGTDIAGKKVCRLFHKPVIWSVGF
jgi:hypothetical protein